MKCPYPLRGVALVLVLCGIVAAPAQADQVCELIDDDTGTEDAGGSSASDTDGIACGYSNTTDAGAAFGRSNAAR